MITINKKIKYIESSDNPLSSNVFFIEGNNNTYIYDVGSSTEAYTQIEGVNKRKSIIISHFHKDHLSNIDRVSFDELYVSNFTCKHINKGTIVKDAVKIEDGVSLEIISASSVHSKGSLLLNVDKEYCLIGDLIHFDGELNKSLACMMINDLTKVETKYFVLGHGNNCVVAKEEMLKSLKSLVK